MRPKTSHLTPRSVERRWYLADAENQVLGRLAVRIATVLMGKHNPRVSDHVDVGDAVVVVNADKVAVTGRKAETKVYERYTGYPGGRREETFEHVREHHPERIVTLAVQRMLPKNKLGRAMLRKLHVYAGPEHPHAAQKPVPLD